jgi:phosphopantetheinyl transferase
MNNYFYTFSAEISGKVNQKLSLMPIFFQKDIDEYTRIAVWKIEEDEPYFLQFVPLQRSIRHPHKRLQHLAGRFLLTHLFPSFPINLIQLADTRKPYLPDEAFHFSISHCGDYAAAIVSSLRRVGVDIEESTEKIGRIAHKFLHVSEKEAITRQLAGRSGTGADMTNDLLTLVWSGKEAMFKWWGNGGVDFSEMLIVSPPEMGEEGAFPGRFLKPPHPVSMEIHYKKIGELYLTWVHT